MHRFWEKVIKPIVIAAQPKIIVEIGSLTGLNTFKVLDYCKHSEAELIIVEPAPQYNYDLLKAYYGDHVTLLQKFSLDALPEIPKYDLLLVDGDHNWYTVYHELKLAEKMAEQSGSFPIILFHDTNWPYGRRDMYYFPESIPEEFRKTYERKGMQPGVSELLESGGFNNIALNAVYEHGERNGVLTAIEDFVKESPFSLRYYDLYSNNGLGIIVPESSSIRKVLPYILESSGL
ncbi:class I SAM-dependent methyltransferase [Paenibacillus filicis]|uniref:Class I SAM-dependent methyltransferase n=1 Tax=Paenibacillus filicis TaxID=669464 RepID=A0ABU9DUV2_9BACL